MCQDFPGQFKRFSNLAFAPTIIDKSDGWLIGFTAPILNDIYTFMGGKSKDLVNKKKDGVIDVIRKLALYIDLLKSGKVVLPGNVEEHHRNEGDEVIIPALMAPTTIDDEGGIDLFSGNNQSPEDMEL